MGENLLYTVVVGGAMGLRSERDDDDSSLEALDQARLLVSGGVFQALGLRLGLGLAKLGLGLVIRLGLHH